MTSRGWGIVWPAIVRVSVLGVLLTGCSSAANPSREEMQQEEASKEITLEEGTNFAVAASPDGRTLVMDLLGSLWALPGQGGVATRITEPMLEARQPAFSPAGDQIAFQGYLDDGWDIWSISPDGSDAKRLTWGPFDDREPHWSRDGTRIAFASDRTGNYDIWILDVGSGELHQLTQDSAQDSQPAWSPDDSEIAFVSTREPGGVWVRNVNSGATRLAAAVPGGGGRGSRGPNAPSWAPDGRLAYTRIDSDATVMLDETPIVSGEDVFPFPVQWTSDTTFLYSADGVIKQRSLGNAGPTTVAFSATLPVKPAPYSTRRLDFDSAEPRRALGIIRPAISPDSQRIVFAAVGDLWTLDVGEKPTRLTSDKYLDADPAFSPDGSMLAFSSDRGGTGNVDLWIRDLATDRDRRLTELPTGDFGASWSPDGTRIAFLSLLSHSSGADVYVVDVGTGTLNKIHHFPDRNPSSPTWSPDGRTVLLAAFIQYAGRFRESVYRLVAIPAEGGEARTIELMTKGAHVVDSGIDAGPVWSPDGTKVAIVNGGVLKTVEVDPNGNPVGAVRQLTNEASHAPAWTSDSRQILFLATDQLKMVSLADGNIDTIPMDIEFQPHMPDGRLTVHAGRLWNGRDETTQTDVDIVIESNRIRSIQPHADSLHSGNVIDGSARTVLPGLIDAHAHVYREYGEALGRLMLSYGVTTGRETAGFAYRSLEIREAWQAGTRVGPRLFVSAPAFDGTRSAFAEMYTIDTRPRLELELERAHRLGYDLIKLYVRLPERFQARATEFAHDHGMHVTSHFLYPAAAFGADGTEHGKSSALGNVYDDTIQIFTATGMAWCPTMALGGIAYIGADDPSFMADERLEGLLADWALDPTRQRVERARSGGPDAAERTLARLKRFGSALATVIHSGGRVIAGTDGPGIPHGAALVAELESYVLGGLTPFEALQAATVKPAEVLGAGADLGAVEEGKLADLILVDGNPLENIRDIRKVRTVIKNGEVFERDDLLNDVLSTSVSSSRR